MSNPTRDAAVAKQKAAARVENARRIAEAVDAFHEAADQIEVAQHAIAEASMARITALRAMRDAGLSISDIAELTDLSASRVQALVRGDRGDGMPGEPHAPDGTAPNGNGDGGEEGKLEPPGEWHASNGYAPSLRS
jgi:hypothetical protein